MDEVKYSTVSVAKHEGKRALQIPPHSWGDKIEIYLEEMECEDVNWTHLDQDGNQRWVLLNSATTFGL
jgi:hypothetical protein